MELPCVTLQDVGFHREVAGEIADNSTRVSLSASNEALVINQRSVFWYKGSTISRKLIYETDIVNAFFTSFDASRSSTVEDTTLTVVLLDSTHIYYRDGRSYVTSFPFKIKNALKYENGVIIEREAATANGVQYLTVTEPMKDLGCVISSSISSISTSDGLVYFPATSGTSVAVTINENDNTMSFYHVRFLNRSNNHAISGGGSAVYKKPSHQLRVTSQQHVGNFGGKDIDIETGDEVKLHRKRSISHTETLSIDRMVSYDFSTKSAQSTTSASSLDSSRLRKDAVLTKFETVKLSVKDNLRNTKIAALSSDNREIIIFRNAQAGLLEMLVFEKSGTGRMNIPKLLNSFDISESFADFTPCSDLPEFLLMISNDNKFVLFNPFNQISSAFYQPDNKVVEICTNWESQIIVKNAANQMQCYYMTIAPKSESVDKILSSFKLLVSPHTYSYLKLLWFNAFAITGEEWDALILVILVVILPFAVNNDHINTSNAISMLLKHVTHLQQRALEDNFQLHEMAPNFVLALHLIREEYKLNVLQSRVVNDLGLVLSQITFWMCWGEKWYSYYGFKASDLNSDIKFPNPQILILPPDIIKSLCSLFESKIIPYCTLSRLTHESEKIDEMITPRTFYVLRLFEAIISPEFSSVDVVNMVSEFNITKSVLETYPAGVVVPIKEAIAFVEKNLTGLNQGIEKFDLIDRKDLKRLRAGYNIESSLQHHQLQYQSKDIHQVITGINDPPEPIAPLEMDRFSITKLIFSEDRRFYEISKILQTFQNQVVFAEDLANLPEEQALQKRKELASLVALRTLTNPLGRSMIFFSSKVPLATERFPLPKINFSAVIQPENVTVSLERSSIDTDALQWGYFHNGVSTGLTISKDSKGISGSWIIFNKPENLSAQHAGFLLGLGLNGHLKSLEEWNIYNYLGPKHFYTSVGLLLGMSASLRGSMDVKLTKVLSVHVVALLPQGASDLIISTQVQAAGLIGIGLLYLETQHRRMSEILLSQVNGNVVVEEKELSDESYRLSAGIGLGYVNLGKGDDLRGLQDSHAVDKLIAIATSMKDVQTEEGFDKSMAGAIIALSFIYLKTNNDVIAKKLEVPNNQHLLDYIRPDLLLLRTLGRNLILWGQIECTEEWFDSQIPKTLISSLEAGDFNTNFYYVLSGLCLSVSLKYASSQDTNARDTIVRYYDFITTLLKTHSGSDNYSSRFVKQSLSHCQTVLAISMALVMAGSGDLDVFRRLRILHGNLSQYQQDEVYGKCMAISMALGFLFLAGGQYAFKTSSTFAIAAMVTSLYPLFPKTESAEPDVHLQALRHFWSMAVEPRCLVVRNVDTSKPVKTEVTVDFKNKESKRLMTPCLLPPIDTIQKVTFESEDYFKLVVDDLSSLNNRLDLFVYKRSRVEVLKQSVRIILKDINEKFQEDLVVCNGKDLTHLDVFNEMKKVDVLRLIGDEPTNGFQPNMVDRQTELNQIVGDPVNVAELWNLKLIFAFYDRLLAEDDVCYLTLEYIDTLKTNLLELRCQLL